MDNKQKTRKRVPSIADNHDALERMRSLYVEQSSETKRVHYSMVSEHVRVFNGRRVDNVVEMTIRRLQNAMRYVHETTRIADAHEVEAFRRRAQRDVYLFRYVLNINNRVMTVASRMTYLIQLDNTGLPLKTCLDWSVIDATLEVSGVDNDIDLCTMQGMRRLIDFADSIHDTKEKGVIPVLNIRQNNQVFHAFVSRLMAYICEYVTYFEEKPLPDYTPCPYQLIHQFMARKMYTNQQVEESE
jgi:hypothetical protein